MKASELRASLLQEAVSGRLVPQMDSEGSAADLLQEIVAERAALVAAGKLKKEKPLPAITEEEKPFEIPESWEWVRLGEVSNFGSNIPVDPITIGESEWVLELEDIEKDTGNILVRKKKSERVSTSTKHKFKKGNVLYSKLRPYLNKVVVADDDGYCTSEIHVLDFGKNVHSDYAKLCLQSPEFLSYTNRCSRGMKMPRLGTADGKRALLPLPPLSEQHRIVAKLDELLPLVDAYEKEEEALSKLNAGFPERMRRSILQEAVSGRLVPQIESEGSAADLLKEIAAEKQALVAAGKMKKEKPLPGITEEEKPFEIPESWEWVRLGELCSKIHYGYTASANISGNAKILRITDIQNNSVDWNSLPYCTVSPDEMTRYSLNNNDILFARTGGTVGKTYLVKDLNKNESVVFASYLIRAVPSPLVNETYLKRLMESPLYWGQIADQAKGTGQDNVNGEKLKRIIFPLPPLAEQRRIVSKLDELMKIIDRM